MFVDQGKTVRLTLSVAVDIDPNDDTLLETIRDSRGTFSIASIVRAEIESDLQSVS